jgi:hypothetical protein
MGLTFTKLFSRLFSKKEMRILMVRWRRWRGLLASGACWLLAMAVPSPALIWWCAGRVGCGG